MTDSSVANWAGATLKGESGSQLRLMDLVSVDGVEDPLLLHMCRGDFTRALAQFERLLAYSNVRYDRQCPYDTGAIREDNPYRGVPDDQLKSQGGQSAFRGLGSRLGSSRRG